MNNYQNLAECIRSGQCSAQEVEAHMSDELFSVWYHKHYA
jgi:hypothetical protein